MLPPLSTECSLVPAKEVRQKISPTRLVRVSPRCHIQTTLTDTYTKAAAQRPTPLSSVPAVGTFIWVMNFSRLREEGTHRSCATCTMLRKSFLLFLFASSPLLERVVAWHGCGEEIFHRKHASILVSASQHHTGALILTGRYASAPLGDPLRR